MPSNWWGALTQLRNADTMHAMRLWFTKRKHKMRRESTMERIRELGFKVTDVSGNYQGKVSEERWILVDPDGKPFDNLGEGFPTIYEAYKAAREWRK